MHDTQSDNVIRIYISPEEQVIIKGYTNISLSLIQEIDAFIEKARAKRKIIKRASVLLSLEKLDILIANIAERANQRNTSPEVQYILDNLFGKLADKYNDNMPVHNDSNDTTWLTMTVN